MKLKIFYFRLISGPLLFILFSSCNSLTIDDISGNWQVVKAEIDGVDVTNQIQENFPFWISLSSTGYYEAGKQMRDYSGDWRFNKNLDQISFYGLNEWWSDSSWIIQKQDNFLILQETKMITKKMVLKPLEGPTPEIRSSGNKNNTKNNVVGTWGLTRSKKNLKLVGESTSSDQWIEFTEDGRYVAGSEDQFNSTGSWVKSDNAITLVQDDPVVVFSWNLDFISNRMLFSSKEYDDEWDFIWERKRSLKGTTVTYLANEGVLIERNGKKVIIDALHDFYKDAYLPLSDNTYQNIVQSNKPFNEINYTLISHPHGDHFDPDYTITYLINHPETELIASSQIIDSLNNVDQSEKVLGNVLSLPDRLENPIVYKKNGVSIEVSLLNHVNEQFASIQNLGHLIEIDGIRVLHVGDADLSGDISEMHYYERGIDVAILPYWYFWDDASADLVKKHIHPSVVLAVHISPDNQYQEIQRVKENWNDAVVFFQEGDTWSGN